MIVQEQVINYLLDTKDVNFITENALSSDYFFNYKSEFEFLKKYLEQYNSLPDKSTFLNKFPEFEVIDVHESKEYLLDTLIHEQEEFIFRNSIRKAAELYNSDKYDEALNCVDLALDKIRSSKHIKDVDIVRDKQRYDTFLDKSENFDKYFIHTGFDELDEELGGGLSKFEELVTIVARPGVGKSQLLIKIATELARQGLNVGIYSGEMSIEKVAYRFDTMAGNISNRDITHGNISVQNEYKQFLDTLPERIPGSIKVITPMEIGSLASVDDLRAFVEKEHLDVLCVDQHSLLIDKNKGRTAVDKAANISTDLHSLQVLKKIPIIAVSQQHRTGSNQDGSEVDLDVSHIAQSDKIGQDSTLVLFLEQKDSVLTMTIAKTRDSGAVGKKLRYTVDFNYGKFTYIPVGDDPKSQAQCEEVQAGYADGSLCPWDETGGQF